MIVIPAIDEIDIFLCTNGLNSVISAESHNDLHKISAGSDRRGISLNVNKCHILQVGTKNKMSGMKL